MKSIVLIFSLVIFLSSSCVIISPPAEPEAQGEVSPLLAKQIVITMENAASIQPAGSLQPSSGAVICSWTGNGRFFWVQDLHNAGLYDSETLDLLAEFEGGEYSAIYDLSPDGKTIAYSIDGQEIRLFDVFTQEDRLTIIPGFAYSTGFFNRDGSQLAIESLEEIEVVQFRTTDGFSAGSLSGFETAAPVYSARYSPDGKSLIWWSRGTVQPISITSGQMGPSLNHEDFVVALAMSSDGRLIATAAAGTLEGDFLPLVTMWDAKNGVILWQNGNPDYFSSLDFSPDGNLLAAGTEGEVILYETATGNEVNRIRTGTEVINSLGFSPDGSALVTCETDGKITLWKPG